MTTSGRESSALACTKKIPGHALLTAALLSEIISGGNAFSMPVGFISMQRIHNKNHLSEISPACDDRVNIYKSHKHASSPLFAIQYYSDKDQWGDDADFAYEQQANVNDTACKQTEHRYYEGTKRAVLGGAAIGTMMAINNAMGMSAGAETATAAAPVSSVGVSEQSLESYSAVLDAQPEVTLPYLEKQIQAAEYAVGNHANSYESSASVAASAVTATVASAVPTSNNNVVTDSTSETTASFSPSFVRYTQEHIPGWIETGHKIYDAAAPKIVAGGKKVVAEVDKRVTPMVIEKEHELLGDKNSAVLDNTLSSVASAGKMVTGMLGKAISFGIEGGVQVAKATPEVIAAGQRIYKTVDEKILPEVVDTSRKMKMIVDKTVPEVVDTSKHAYDTIMPEFVNAEKQIVSTMKSGVDMAMPTVNTLLPELSKIERDVLGEERAAIVERTVAEAAQQGQGVFQTVEKTIPQVLASGQKTVDNVAYTGRTVANAVPVMVETGKQAYNSVDRSISDAISTTQDIASDLDRAAGKTAYAIENNLNGVTGTIDKTLPALLEVGRQAAVSGSVISKTVESGSKAIYEDVYEFVDDLRIDKTINSAGKRFAATKPIFHEITASVNDPNQMGKL